MPKKKKQEEVQKPKEEKVKKKRHKLKKKTINKIDGDFNLICADLSLRCPGFSKLSYNSKTRTATLIRKSCVNNIGDTKKPHGQLLYEIGQDFLSYLDDTIFFLCVRERGISRFAAETQGLFRVVGLTDMMLWLANKQVFMEVAIQAIKKILTGNGRATKEEVANALELYIGKQEYSNDNESDSVAVGIAWLIENGYIDKIELQKENNDGKIL